MHWRQGDQAFIDGFEAALARNLAGAAAVDNPAANWFLGISSLLFGGLFMLIAIWVFGQVFPRPS
ncbi:hypothetical protein D3C83_264670 [compost metagenome]